MAGPKGIKGINATRRFSAGAGPQFSHHGLSDLGSGGAGRVGRALWIAAGVVVTACLGLGGLSLYAADGTYREEVRAESAAGIADLGHSLLNVVDPDGAKRRAYAPVDPGLRFALSGSTGALGFERSDLIASLAQNPPVRRARHTIESGDTLVGLLTKAGATRAEANETVYAMADIYSPRKIRAGQAFDLMFARVEQGAAAGVVPASDNPAPQAEDFALWSVRFRTDVDREVVIRRDEEGRFTAKEEVETFTKTFARVRGTIDSSLYLDAKELGVPDRVIVEMIRLYAYQIDFSSDIRRGDAFELFYEAYTDDEGTLRKTGEILFASMTNRGKARPLYRFTPGDGQTDFFDPEGQSARQFLMRTPVNATRISSRFGKRFHPVKKTWRAHKGVDFAAPTGTHIYAAGNGVVTYAGWGRGYGRWVEIKHSNGYTTRYAHMSGFRKGIRKGTRVRQGETIGYVGSTGWSTGPHLHYEVRKNGEAVNPLSVRVPSGRNLKGKELQNFKRSLEQTRTLIASVNPIETVRTADAGGANAGGANAASAE